MHSHNRHLVSHGVSSKLINCDLYIAYLLFQRFLFDLRKTLFYHYFLSVSWQNTCLPFARAVYRAVREKPESRCYEESCSKLPRYFQYRPTFLSGYVSSVISKQEISIDSITNVTQSGSGKRVVRSAVPRSCANRLGRTINEQVAVTLSLSSHKTFCRMKILCIICHDQLILSEEVFFTRCGHVFHHQCLLQWLER